MDDTIRDLGRGGIVADDDDGAAFGGGQLRDRAVDDARALGVELSGRLVGQQEPWPVGEGCAERDSLLLAARELCRPRVRAGAEPDVSKQLLGPRVPKVGLRALCPQLQPDELPGAELRRERPHVVLVEIPDAAR